MTLPTWSGSMAPLSAWRLVLAGWIRHFTRRALLRLDPTPHFMCPMCGTEEQSP